jgi:hypothetical protein
MSNGDKPAGPPASAEPVPTESIEKAPVEVPASGAPSQEEREHEALTRADDQAQFQQELGFLGKFFGGKREKPGNISALLSVLCVLIIAARVVAGKQVDPPMLTGLLSIITLTLGYLFGKGGNKE